MPGPTSTKNPWAAELNKKSQRRRSHHLKEDGGEWGEEDEWEWEESDEEEQKEQSEVPENPNKVTSNNSSMKMSSTANGSATNGTSNGTNNTAKQNGTLSNGIANGHHINEEDHQIEEVNGKADIKIQGNLLKIERTGPVEWSDDEYEDDEEEVEENNDIPPPPPPPPPPTNIPPPPPPPPPTQNSSNEIDEARARKLQKIEQMKKRPAKRPDWNELMKEIDSFRYGKVGRLNKVVTNDRSKPILTKTKIKGQYIYDSEQKGAEHDIMDDIKKGVRLKHVRTNDRSKPMLAGIRSFRPQISKEERFKNSISMDNHDFYDDEDAEDMVALRDDLESTKQLLELEVRSKKLLEKDNKRLAQELEKLKQEMCNKPGISNEPIESSGEDPGRARRNSIANKRHSVIRLLSESENKETEQEVIAAAVNNNHHEEEINEEEENDNAEDELSEMAESTAEPELPQEYMEEIEEMREEVDEARKLAEEWESRYKDMQRQMSELETSRHKKHSLVLESAGFDFSPSIQHKASFTSEYEENDDDGDYAWMLKREIHTLNHKLRNIRDKREIVVRERQLLTERIETLVGSIGNELDGRKRLKREINEMNEAFKEEILEMEAEQKAAAELEECYFDDDIELVPNTHKRDSLDDDEDWEANDEDEDEQIETVEDLITMAEEDECDYGAELFECYPDSDDEDVDESELNEEDYEPTRETLNKRVEKHNENVHIMRKSNFMLKAKIDRLYDILQMQKEKHHDLRQELTRMLADIQ